MRPLDPRLLTYAKDARTYIILLVITGALSAFFVIGQSIFIAQAASPIIDGSGTLHASIMPIIGIAVMFALRVVTTYIQEAFGHRSALKVMRDLRERVLVHSTLLGPRYLSEGKSSATVQLVTDSLDDLEPYFVKFLPQLILCMSVTPISIFVILLLDWISAIAIIVCIPLIPVFMILIGKMTQKFSDERIEMMQRLGAQLLDLLAGLATLKALGREDSPKKRVRELGLSYAQATMRTLSVAFLSGAVLEFLATLSTALVAVEVGLRMVEGSVGLFSGLTIIMLTPEVFKPLREVGSQFHASSDGVTTSAKVFDILALPVQTKNTSQASKGDRASSSLTPCPDLSREKIILDSVSVKAPGRDLFAPLNVSGEITPGSLTVLAGNTGAGKSTLVSLLLGLLAPTCGSIKIGGVDIRDIDNESVWQQVSWVPQNPALVPGSVKDNIEEFSARTLNNEILSHAAHLSGFEEVLTQLPDGWETIIGQGGIGLSVGQRQRLALMRALIEQRPLVIFDEPSAHLDAQSERYVLDCIHYLLSCGSTVLVIAHRTTLISAADCVIEVHASTREEYLELSNCLTQKADTSPDEREEVFVENNPSGIHASHALSPTYPPHQPTQQSPHQGDK